MRSRHDVIAGPFKNLALLICADRSHQSDPKSPGTAPNPVSGFDNFQNPARHHSRKRVEIREGSRSVHKAVCFPFLQCHHFAPRFYLTCM